MASIDDEQIKKWDNDWELLAKMNVERK